MTAQVALTFLGGAGTVTGSKFLVDAAGTRVLVDCGLFQGLRDLRRRNWEPLPVPAHTVDAVLLTHAHLDHCGYLPALVRHGFTGRVLSTPGTRDLAEIVLRDSAHLQEEDAEIARERGSSRHDPPRALYTTQDVERLLPLMESVPFGTEVQVAGPVRVRFDPAGHILGSSVVRLDAAGQRIVFSGDLGRASHPLLVEPAPLGAADVVVVESTYGDRQHPEPDRAAVAGAIRAALDRGGSVLVPAFAIDRTEVVLAELARMMADGLVPAVPVLVDSPMALKALQVYREALAREAADVAPDADLPLDVLEPPTLRELATAEESRAVNQPRRPSILVSASGMASGGRVVHHLASLLPDQRNLVLIVGFQAEGTRGRDLLEGAEVVKCLGEYVPVRAEVLEVPWLSVHADADDLLAWLATATRAPRACYVVHGEPLAAHALAKRVRRRLGWVAVAPRAGERVVVGPRRRRQADDTTP